MNEPKFLKLTQKDFAVVFWTAFVGFATALIGAYTGAKYAYRLETKRQQSEDREIFSYKLAALRLEAENNLRIIDELRKTLTLEGGDIRELRTDAANKVIEDFITYKDGRRGLFESVWYMVTALDEVNNLTDIIIDHFEEPRRHLRKTVDEVQRLLDVATNRIQVVR